MVEKYMRGFKYRVKKIEIRQKAREERYLQTMIANEISITFGNIPNIFVTKVVPTFFSQMYLQIHCCPQ